MYAESRIDSASLKVYNMIVNEIFTEDKNMKKVVASLAFCLMFVLLFTLVACNIGSQKQYTVCFDTHGGSYIDDVEVDDCNTIAYPKQPVKEGYVFLGWYKDSGYTVEFDFASRITHDLTLHARWLKVSVGETNTHVITFNVDGGTAVNSMTVEDGKTLNNLPTTSKTNSSFEGWYLDSACSQKFDSTQPIFSDIVLYAKWTLSDDKNTSSNKVSASNINFSKPKVSVQAKQMSSITEFVSFRDDDCYYFVFDLGTYLNVPTDQPYAYYYYNGAGTLSREITAKSTKSESVRSSVSKTLSDTVTVSSTKSVGIKFGADLGAAMSLKIEAGYSRTKGESSQTSWSDTYEDVAQYSETEENTISVSFSNGDHAGRYYYYLSMDVQAYGVIVKNIETGEFDTTVCSSIIGKGYNFLFSESNEPLDFSCEDRFNFDDVGLIEKFDLYNYVPTEYVVNSDIGNEIQDGSEANPYRIYTINDLKNIKSKNETEPKTHYRLENDIDLTGYEWTPIGYSDEKYEAFTGVFDGNGHTIKGLTRTIAPQIVGNEAYAGLFAILDGATVCNLKFEDVNMVFPNISKEDSYTYVGALTGYAKNNSVIEKIAVNSGTIRAGEDSSCKRYEYVGGIVGAASDSKIKYCANKANVLGYHDTIWIGGILGYANGGTVNVRNCYNTGYIEIRTQRAVGYWTGSAGGIVGVVKNGVNVFVQYCYVKCKIKNFNGYHRDIGGIIATMTDTSRHAQIDNNYYCVQALWESNGDFKDNVNEIYNSSKPGYKVSSDQLTSGEQVGNLFSYANAISSNDPEDYCWVYEKGQLPKLFWE